MDWDSRGFQLADRGGNSPFGQVIARVIVEPDDQDAWVVTAYDHDQVVSVFEVFRIPGQDRQSLSECEDQDPWIRD